MDQETGDLQEETGLIRAVLFWGRSILILLRAYVFVDDRLVNAELITSGFAVVRLHPPNVRYADLFMKLQAEAMAHQRGLWASSAGH